MKLVIGLFSVIMLVSVIWWWGSMRNKKQIAGASKIKEMIKLTSPDFTDGQMIPAKYTCDGENISPPLEISEIPPGTVSLALIVDDPDAPIGTWVHWLVWNIDPQTATIAAGRAPDRAVEGTTSFNKPGWGGPCPPSGTHHYQFKLYALDKKLELAPSERKDGLEKAMDKLILDKTTLTGLYKRQ